MISPIFRSAFCLLLTAYCLLVFASSCKQKTNYSKEISRLDSSVVNLKETEKLLLSVDTFSLRRSSVLFKEKLHLISQKLSGDTVRKKAALLLSDAYEQEGNLSNLLENNKYLHRAVMEGMQRISDLKHDLAEDVVEKNKAAEYIVNELNASQKVCEIINNTIAKAKKSSIKLDSLKTKIIFLADSLTSK